MLMITYGILSTEPTMAERNLSVTASRLRTEMSNLLWTSGWLRACSGLTSYGRLLWEDKQTHSRHHPNQSGVAMASLSKYSPACFNCSPIEMTAVRIFNPASFP